MAGKCKGSDLDFAKGVGRVKSLVGDGGSGENDGGDGNGSSNSSDSSSDSNDLTSSDTLWHGPVSNPNGIYNKAQIINKYEDGTIHYIPIK